MPKDAADVEDDATAGDKGLWYVCRSCRQRLTRPDDRVVIQGSHRHTFANPSGVVFEIGCFASARGFGRLGAPSVEFTWFAGYSWQIVICAGCRTHIGWFFAALNGQGRFLGLIMDRMTLVSLPAP